MHDHLPEKAFHHPLEDVEVEVFFVPGGMQKYEVPGDFSSFWLRIETARDGHQS